MFVPGVVSRFYQYAVAVSIAPQNATTDIKAVMFMTEQLAYKVKAYRTAMSIIKEMLNSGLISN